MHKYLNQEYEWVEITNHVLAQTNTKGNPEQLIEQLGMSAATHKIFKRVLKRMYPFKLFFFFFKEKIQCQKLS